MFYVVIDTNVIVSSILKEDSNPGLIMQYINKEIIIPIINNEIFEEYLDVISRNKFSFSKKTINKFKKDILRYSIFIPRLKTSCQFVDKTDLKFYETALNSLKYRKTYLVTGNLKHFPNNEFIVSPKQMVEIIQNSLQI